VQPGLLDGGSGRNLESRSPAEQGGQRSLRQAKGFPSPAELGPGSRITHRSCAWWMTQCGGRVVLMVMATLPMTPSRHGKFGLRSAMANAVSSA
jgi:hypothetical protein